MAISDISKGQTISTVTQMLDILRARRRALNLTQHDVAQKLGITQAYVSDIESGRRTVTAERLIALMNVLNLELTARDKQPVNDKADW